MKQLFEFPVVDNHIHINLDYGFGVDAIKIFQRFGGTHIFLVSLPSWSYKININKEEDYDIIFKKTLQTANIIQKETNIKVYPILGVHPLEILYINNKYTLSKKINMIYNILNNAKNYILERKAYGIKSGRIHFFTSNEINNASNKILNYSLNISKENNFPIQVHDKNMSPQNIFELSKMIKLNKLKNDKFINHHAMPYIQLCEKNNIFPSITSKIKLIEKSLNQGTRFLFETDYMDDKTRPGSVVGTRTIPRVIRKLLSKYNDEIFWKINKENIEKIYDIEIS